MRPRLVSDKRIDAPPTSNPDRAAGFLNADEYREHLKSHVADLNNVGPRGGGAITAGLFLKEFAGDRPWAHLDIAGPAFIEKDTALGPKGATGCAVRTILTYLTDAGR